MINEKAVLPYLMLYAAFAVLCDSRVVKVPPGPLVHVVGHNVSIRCDVSDYEGPRDQDFEWSLLLDQKLIPIISTFDSSFTDPSMKDRVSTGDISVKKLGDAAAELKFRKIRVTDSGTYHCSTPSTDSSSSGNYFADVELKVIGDNLKVVPVVPKTLVSEGESVAFYCNITRGFTEDTFLSVTWSYRNGSSSLEEILTFGPDDQIKVGSNYAKRYTDGGLHLDFQGGGLYGLIFNKARPSDNRYYVCMAQEWVRQGDQGKTWRKILEKSVEMGQVQVEPTELQYKVTLEALLSPRSSGEPTELHCAVTGLLHLSNGHLGVTWIYSSNVSAGVTIASLDQLGALVTNAPYQERLERGEMAVSRREANLFVLRILQTDDADMGSYSCNVTAWTPTLQGGWERAKDVQSLPVTVQWSKKEPALQVVAYRVREASVGGSTFEMSCQVTGQNLQNPGYSVLIGFEETLGGKSRKVLSLNQDSVMQLEEWSEPSRIDSVVLEKTGLLEYRFRLYGAQVTDRGFYYCEVAAWKHDQSQDWIKVTSVKSNKIQIAFAHTGPVFNISVRSDSSVALPGDTVRIKCIISVLNATNTGDVSFDVSWFQDHDQAIDNGGKLPLISMDRRGVVKKSRTNDSSLERTDRYSFELSLHKIQSGGEYHCAVTPWTLSLATGAWNKENDLLSNSVLFSVKQELWESLKMPVGYGLLAAVMAGLVSVLLGLSVAHCCFSRNPMHTPRPHNKLLEFSMD